MPNIEIHAFGESLQHGTIPMYDRLTRLLAETEYEKEVVLTMVDDTTTDLHNTYRPFLRVVTTPIAFLDDLIRRLKTLKVDIEVQSLAAFHEAEK